MLNQKTQVVNLRKAPYDVYIGREVKEGLEICHYGNPFTHLSYGAGHIKVKTREEAVSCFAQWLANDKTIIEPERRKWILANLKNLKNKRLGCFCKPLSCHGDVLAKLADKT